VKDYVQHNLVRIVERQHERLKKKVERLQAFFNSCDEEDLALARGALCDGAQHDQTGEELKLEKPTPAIRVPEFGPTTYRGTPRKRTWGVLFPAIVQVIETMDGEITSPRIHDALKAEDFKFSTERAVSSIAAVLRKIEFDGALKKVSKGNARPVAYRKDPRGLKALALKKRSVNPPGSLAAEVIRAISSVPVPFTTVQVIEKLKRGGFTFGTESPGSSVNAVFARLVKRDQIRLLSKGIGPRASTYERTAMWGSV
jgi:hypothetical protein